MVSDGEEARPPAKSGHAKCAGVSLVLDITKLITQSRCIFQRSQISDCYKKFVYSL